MRIVGVVSEYNPFHRGHAYHLAQARALSGADYVVAVMSGCFTQRGDAALLSPSDRARMALTSGADAVFALPACWAVRDAEHFALGGVAILNGLGCDAISFGTERDDLPLIQQAAEMLESGDPRFSQAVRTRMTGGAAYPAAVSAAMAELLPGAGELLSTPNATLSVCYLRAMLRLQSRMTAVPVLRRGAYHASDLSDVLPSATAVRGAVLRGDWQRVRSALPEAAWPILQDAALNGRIHRPGALDSALTYRLRTMTAADYAALPDVSEGVEMRLADAAQQFVTREDILQAAKTRRYPYARLSRLATHALLGLTEDALQARPLPDAAWLLGFRTDAALLLKALKARTTLPILSKAADADRSVPWFHAEQRAYDLWALGAGLPAGLAMTQGVARV